MNVSSISLAAVFALRGSFFSFCVHITQHILNTRFDLVLII